MLIAHDFFAALAFFFIDKIADQHIQRLFTAYQLPQRIQNRQISVLLYPVVAVYNLKIDTLRVFYSRIHRRTMTAVLLMDGAHYRRVLCSIFVRDTRGIIL